MCIGSLFLYKGKRSQQVSKDSKNLAEFLQELKSEFKILSEYADYFLGVKIEKDEGNI